ncbi:MAG: 30S ribosomal protein S6 [Thermoleophilia bacterium]|nr:30S ribosomal protein S6 [Thermoleophilia bacterium]
MNEYEIMLLTRTDLDDAARTAIVDRAKEAVTSKAGSWGEVAEWGRRPTSYPIQKLSDAWYQVLTFDGTGETVDEAVRVLRITEGVLRVMATNRVAPYPKEAELEKISDEELAAGPKDRGRGGRGGRGRGRDRD